MAHLVPLHFKKMGHQKKHDYYMRDITTTIAIRKCREEWFVLPQVFFLE